MIKKLCLLAGSLVLLGVASVAQPILTATGVSPVVGENFTHFVSASYYSPGSAGANQTWDLTSISGSSTGVVNVVTPGSTANGASFPNANAAFSYPSGSVSYYKTSATALQNYGAFTSGVVMAYTNPEDILHFPFNYTNTYNDGWSAQFNSGGYDYYRVGTTSVTADGYGTLTTPIGIYTNVMRVHINEEYEDSAYIGGPYYIDYSNDEYIWYKEGTHIQIAWVYTFISSISGTINVGAYLSANYGMEDMANLISSSNLYPNPASDIVNIDFTLTENRKSDIRIFNALGQQVKISETIEGIQGVNNFQLNMADMPEGIYYAQILVEDKVAANKRFIIAR